MAQNQPPIDRRGYRYKNPHMSFLCPLCRTERYFSMSPRLTAMNYAQIAMITLAITAASWPWTSWKGAFSFFIVWATFEFWRRLLFRKEIPCPHCGFDASWYKRDVKKARQLVKDFWANHPQGQQAQATNSEAGRENENPDSEENEHGVKVEPTPPSEMSTSYDEMGSAESQY